MKRGGRQKSKKKKASNRFNNQNNNCARPLRVFVHFFADAARLRRENA